MERESEREREGEKKGERERERRESVCLRERERVSECVCVNEREGGREGGREPTERERERERGGDRSFLGEIIPSYEQSFLFVRLFFVRTWFIHPSNKGLLWTESYRTRSWYLV